MEHLPLDDKQVRELCARLAADASLERLSGYVGLDVSRALSNVRGVFDFQVLTASFLEAVLEQSSDGFTYSGAENIDSRGHLFVSNHRDILLDSALLNYVIGGNGHATAFNVFGDNLAEGLAGDLLRANKGYMLKRSGYGKERIRALHDLSCFMINSIGLGHSVWIAQRDGRSKDGLDRTNPALFRHLHYRHRAIPFDIFISQLKIIPVSVSYEFDPCEMSKARELFLRDSKGSYQKTSSEDMSSMLLGLTDRKGRIHLAVGTTLEGTFRSVSQVAEEIDRQIISNYHLFPSNHEAVRLLEDPQADVPLRHRISEYPAELQPYVLRMYANPVFSQRELR